MGIKLVSHPEEQDSQENYIMRNVIFVPFIKYYSVHQIENGMGRTGNTYGKYKKYTQNIKSENAGKRPFVRPGVDRRKILTWIFKKNSMN